MKVIFNNLRALFKFIILILWLIFFLPFTIIGKKISKEAYRVTSNIFFKVILRILSVRSTISSSEDYANLSALFISNHVSYVDIFLLGANFDFKFTPKDEISKWPIISSIVNISDPIYIKRDPKKSLEQKEAIKEAVQLKDSVLLFPEGTTSNGTEILKFKSSLFGVLESKTSERDIDEYQIPLYGLIVSYKTINGQTIDQKLMDKVAWYDDMTFFPHFWKMLQLRSIDAEIEIIGEINYQDFQTRKEIAKHCEDILRKEFESNKD